MIIGFARSDIGIQQGEKLLLCILRCEDSHSHGLRGHCCLSRSRLSGNFFTHLFQFHSSFRQFLLNLILRFHSQADYTSLAKRASAFGLLTGVCSAAFVCGTLASRFLATDYIFPVFFFIRKMKLLSCSLVLCFEIQCVVLWFLCCCLFRSNYCWFLYNENVSMIATVYCSLVRLLCVDIQWYTGIDIVIDLFCVYSMRLLRSSL